MEEWLQQVYIYSNYRRKKLFQGRQQLSISSTKKKKKKRNSTQQPLLKEQLRSCNCYALCNLKNECPERHPRRNRYLLLVCKEPGSPSESKVLLETRLPPHPSLSHHDAMVTGRGMARCQQLASSYRPPTVTAALEGSGARADRVWIPCLGSHLGPPRVSNEGT